MVSFSLRKLKEKHDKPKFPGDFFELQRKKPKVSKQVVSAIENQQNNIREFTKKNFEVVTEMFRKYLMFILHVGTAFKHLGKFDAVSYFKYLVSALKYNYNYFGKRALEHYIKMNFFMLCLIFNYVAEQENTKLSDENMKVFLSSVKYFCMYLAWERSESDFIMNTVISIVTQMLVDHKKKLSEKFTTSVNKALNFYKNYAKTKTLPKESNLDIQMKRDEDFEYFEGVIKNMFSQSSNFLDPNGSHEQVLKK